MRALIIANPSAGQGQHRQHVNAALEILRAHSWDVTFQVTEQPGDATRLARKAVNLGYDAVLGAGGDGTLNEILQALIDTPVALGVLPVGTANIWARELGLPLEPARAAELLVESEIRLMDAGLAEYRQGIRYFFLLASVGYDAAVTGSIDLGLKRQLGMLAYIIAAFKLAFSYVGTPVRIQLAKWRLRARLLFVVISNTRIYGGLVKLSPDACVDDGLLNIELFRGRGWGETMRHYLTIALGRHRDLPDALNYRSHLIAIRSRRPLAVQLDGDLVGTTPLRIRCMKRCLHVLVPPSVTPGLFQQNTPSRSRSIR